ncbi:MAG: S8 family serine peptidase [Chloroflexi bacterium]|nr:S8 family serine peptidase [Chloroflexota bacterium]
MIKKWMFFIVFLVLLGAVISANLRQQTAAASEDPIRLTLPEEQAKESSPPTSQIIVKFKESAAMAGMMAADGNGRAAQLSQAAGVQVSYLREMSGDSYVYKLPQALPVSEVTQMIANMTALPDVEYAEPDRILGIDGQPQRTVFTPDLVPNDSRYGEQWHYKYTAGTSEGMNLEPTWDKTTGSSSTVVAVIDTGILLGHTDLSGKLVPGYDFITDVPTANDGNGRDSNPSDPGDWTNPDECFTGWPGSTSSWHGTHVGGTIGASTNNNLGVAGVNWNAKLLPVRVLGRCGGFTSDILDGMRWAAGIAVSGVPANANPAKVLNLSLGGGGVCSNAQQSAIDDIVNVGAVVVVAAGNENQNASNVNPASCNNVVTVAANDRGGDKASYSNFGSVVDVAAPGGETAITANGILSTLDSGVTIPANDNAYAFYQGTSMATPHVAGLVSLMFDYKPTLTTGQLTSLLQSSARSFPTGSSCTTSLCGSGIADGQKALAAIDNLANLTNHIYLPSIMVPLPPATNPFQNPGFESGRTVWTEYSQKGFILIYNDSILPLSPHSGSWAAWLAGDVNEVSFIEQVITVDSRLPYLAYWHWIASQESNCTHDLAGVVINGDVSNPADLYPLCDGTETGGWAKHVVDLSAYNGQTIEVRIQGQTDSNDKISHLFIDDVTMQATASISGTPSSSEGVGALISKQMLTP